jgi:hypothetical protein
MAEKNTPLSNELLEQVGQHPDFPTWRQNGKLPAGPIEQLCEPLKTDPRYVGQPSRFYISAIALVNYIYKTWLALMKFYNTNSKAKPVGEKCSKLMPNS